jgi:hypothetical protein
MQDGNRRNDATAKYGASAVTIARQFSIAQEERQDARDKRHRNTDTDVWDKRLDKRAKRNSQHDRCKQQDPTHKRREQKPRQAHCQGM